MSNPLRVLLVEDSEDDALLTERELRRHGYALSARRVDTPASLSEALTLPDWDVIITDHNLPGFGSEEALLEYALKNKKAMHYKQLRFLAEKHQGAILKLRFVLNPFAFLFLLEGKELFHIVLETFNTEEATYVWHLEKNRELLPENLTAIDEDLATIRNKGRQAFLAAPPKNFSRIIHNYSNERKGFILWRDMLEEKLF